MGVPEDPRLSQLDLPPFAGMIRAVRQQAEPGDSDVTPRTERDGTKECCDLRCLGNAGGSVRARRYC